MLLYLIDIIYKQFMATRVTPTFLLKGLDPNKLLADYQTGFFSRPITTKQKIKIANNTAILAPTYGTTNHAPVFCVKDRNNCSIIIATTGHSDFEVFNRTGGALPAGGRCDYCKEDFNGVSVGYPVAYQETTVLTNDAKDSKLARYRVLYTFWVEGKFCSFECALGYVRNVLSRPAEYRDTTLRDSERMLKTLYKLMHPNAGILRAAQDPRLLQINSGSLNKEEWSDNKHVYIRTDRILMIPAKVEYVQQNFLNPVLAIDYSKDAATSVILST
jgi:hypothetical protein